MREQKTWEGDDIIRNLLQSGQLNCDPALMKMYEVRPPRTQNQKNKDKRCRQRRRRKTHD